jgi:hypothetical protein
VVSDFFELVDADIREPDVIDKSVIFEFWKAVTLLSNEVSGSGLYSW